MKQYLIVKMTEGLNQAAGWIAMPGLYTWEVALEWIAQAEADNPGARFSVQEVGAA